MSDTPFSPYFWDEETGRLIDRETGEPVLGEDGQPIIREPDPEESQPYEGPTMWAFTAYRLDLPPETAVTILVENPDVEVATAIFNETAGAGMAALSVKAWAPSSLAQHKRWMSAREGNVAAIIRKD